MAKKKNEEQANELITLEEVDVKRLEKSGGSILNVEQMNILLGVTPNKCRYSRQGKGGGTWTYVKGVYVKKVLNMIFGWDWDFEVVNEKLLGDHSKKGEFVIVLGKLKCRVWDEKRKMVREIVKMQYGRKEVKYLNNGGYLDIGNDFKAAATDALKKCANELGVASDVYQAEDYKYVKIVDASDGDLVFNQVVFNTREQYLDAINMELRKGVKDVDELNELLAVHPHMRKDSEVMGLFEEKRQEFLRD